MQGQCVCICDSWSTAGHWERYIEYFGVPLPGLFRRHPTLVSLLVLLLFRGQPGYKTGTFKENKAVSCIVFTFSLRVFRGWPVLCTHMLLFRFWKGNWMLTASKLYSSVGVVTRPRAGRLSNHGWIIAKVSNLSLPKHPDRLQDIPNLLLNKYLRLFLGEPAAMAWS
jgi:hypothetical protein